jgi:hypothetical protein
MEMDGIVNPGLELKPRGESQTTNTKLAVSVAELDKIIAVLSENENIKFKEEYMVSFSCHR